ncbi:MAG: hypothetical protein ACE5HR_00400 [bacterium]
MKYNRDFHRILKCQKNDVAEIDESNDPREKQEIANHATFLLGRYVNLDVLESENEEEKELVSEIQYYQRILRGYLP